MDWQQQMINQATVSSSVGKIDGNTEAVARTLCQEDRFSPDAPFAIMGGFIPAWSMYVSEATKLIKLADNIDAVSAKLKEWRKHQK